MDISVGYQFKGVSIKSFKLDNFGGLYINYAYTSKPEVTGFIHFTSKDIQNHPFLQIIYIWMHGGWDSMVKFCNEMNDEEELIMKYLVHCENEADIPAGNPD